MINRGLLRKNLQESALLMLGCGCLVAAFSFFRVWVVGRIDTGRFRQIIELLPKDWERFSSVDFEWIVSYLGRTAMTLEEPMLMMLIGGWALVRGSDVVAGEVGRGTMEMLLAQPLSRRRIYWQQFAVNLGGIVFLAGLCWGAMWLATLVASVKETTIPAWEIPLTGIRIPIPGAAAEEIRRPMREVVNAGAYWPGLVNLVALGIFLAGMASWISSRDRFGWRATGICVGIFFLQAMLKIGSMAAAGMAWLGWGTVFSLFDPALHIKLVDESPGVFWNWIAEKPVQDALVPGPLLSNLSLVLGGLLLAWWGASHFQRRDLPAPS